MCQRRQNSVMDVERYGQSKFSGSGRPRVSDAPRAMSV
jgi:hypothetical protein